MADSKIHPPSVSRIQAARSAGMAPRTVLVGLAGAFLAAVLHLRWGGRALYEALLSLVRGPLEAFASGHPERALPEATLALRALSVQGLGFAVAVLLGSALGLWLAQGPSFGWPRSSARFEEPKPVRSLPLLAGVVFVALSISLLRDALWVAPDKLGALVSTILARVAVALVALAIVDTAFARASFFRALWMTPREQREELREAYGAPETRAERARLRQDRTRNEAP